MLLGWGLLGLGRHVETRIGPALDQARSVRRVAVCSRDRAKAAETARRFGFARAYDDYDAMLADPEVEAVYIATPNSLHPAQTEAAARAGKHVLCEKPMALTVPDAEAMIEVCRRAGVRLGIGYHVRHHPLHQAARDLIRAGEVGPISLSRAEFGLNTPVRPGWLTDPAMVGGNATMGALIHALDLLLYLTGDRVVEVTALTNGQRPERPIEDMALALLRFAGGGFGYVSGGRRVPRALGDFVLYGKRARLHGLGTVGTSPGGSLEIATDTGVRRLEGGGPDLYARQFDAFAAAVAAGRDPDASGEDGLVVVRVASALLESAATGRSSLLG